MMWYDCAIIVPFINRNKSCFFCLLSFYSHLSMNKICECLVVRLTAEAPQLQVCQQWNRNIFIFIQIPFHSFPFFSCRHGFTGSKALRNYSLSSGGEIAIRLSCSPHMNNSWLCAYGPWLLEDNECVRSWFPSAFPSCIWGQSFSGMITHSAQITVHIPLWLYWPTEKPKGRSLLLAIQPHTKPPSISLGLF